MLAVFRIREFRRFVRIHQSAPGDFSEQPFFAVFAQPDDGAGSFGLLHATIGDQLDQRIDVSAPVIMVSSWFYGGCPCESGRPIHSCGEWGTNNAEIAAMASPRPLLVVSDGGDWTANVPEIEFPYLQKIYDFYGRQNLVENVHLPNEIHDYGPSKRIAVYEFMAKQLGLNTGNIKNSDGHFDEVPVTVQRREDMLVFGKAGEKLPAHAIHGLDQLRKLFQ